MLNRYSMKIAYIIFLILCMVTYMIAQLLGLEFESWNKIICAVTIASYFFTVASSLKTITNQNTLLIDYTNDSIKSICKMREDIEPLTEKNNVISVEKLDQFVIEDVEAVNRLNKRNAKYNALIVIFNVAGFLAFFCIMTFKCCFSFFENSLDIYTLIAFFLVLLSDFVEDIWKEVIGRKINIKEDKNNG